MCSIMARPILLTGMFREVLIRHFQSGTIEDPALQHLIWRATAQTGILIESVHRWLPQTTGKRPAVVIKRNSYRNQRLGIGDRNQGNPIDRTGHPHFSTFWVGSHTLFCIGESGAQAELLATEVQREFTEFGPLLREMAQLKRFQVLEIGAVGELEEAAEHYVVPVNVGYAYEQSWVIQQQAPLLSRISLSTLLDC